MYYTLLREGPADQPVSQSRPLAVWPPQLLCHSAPMRECQSFLAPFVCFVQEISKCSVHKCGPVSVVFRYLSRTKPVILFYRKSHQN